MSETPTPTTEAIFALLDRAFLDETGYEHRIALREGARCGVEDLEREKDYAIRYGNRVRTDLNEEIDRWHEAVRNLRDVKGRHHTQQAMERLLALLPESTKEPTP